jgi:hypothetical protein
MVNIGETAIIEDAEDAFRGDLVTGQIFFWIVRWKAAAGRATLHATTSK